MVTESAIELAMSFLKHLPDEMYVKKAYLFGSHARGNSTEYSDIDLAIVIGSNHNIFDIQMQMLRVRRKIDLRIEPHPIKESDFSTMNPFVDEIIRSGIKLL
jgi:predicted nucleotidyltransferase